MRILALLTATAALTFAFAYILPNSTYILPNYTNHLFITNLSSLWLNDLPASENPMLGIPGSVTLCSGLDFYYGCQVGGCYSGCAWLNVLSVRKCLEIGTDNTSAPGNFNPLSIAPDRYGYCYLYSDTDCRHGLDGPEPVPIHWPGESDLRFAHARSIKCNRCEYPICEHKDVPPYKGVDGYLTDERTPEMTMSTFGPETSGSVRFRWETVLTFNNKYTPTPSAGGYNSTPVEGCTSASPAGGN